MEISSKQTSIFGEVGSMCFQEDSPANHTAWQEKDSAKKMTDTSGRKCLEQFGRFNRAGSWAKTFAALLVGEGGWYSTRCSLSWKLKGTKYSRFYFQLSPKTHLTEGIESGLLPTASARDYKGASGQRKVIKTETGYSEVGPQVVIYGARLPTLAMKGMLPTPTADDNPAKNTGKRDQDSLQKRAFQITGQTSQLNPLFVAEMMGFPVDWTVLPFQNGEMKV